MKKKLIAITLMALPLIGISQNSKQIDSTAIFILDQMSHVIGDLESVTFKLNTSVDKINDDNNIEKHYSKSTVAWLVLTNYLQELSETEAIMAIGMMGNI